MKGSGNRALRARATRRRREQRPTRKGRGRGEMDFRNPDRLPLLAPTRLRYPRFGKRVRGHSLEGQAWSRRERLARTRGRVCLFHEQGLASWICEGGAVLLFFLLFFLALCLSRSPCGGSSAQPLPRARADAPWVFSRRVVTAFVLALLLLAATPLVSAEEESWCAIKNAYKPNTNDENGAWYVVAPSPPPPAFVVLTQCLQKQLLRWRRRLMLQRIRRN
jgi:hypothetical protein